MATVAYREGAARMARKKQEPTWLEERLAQYLGLDRKQVLVGSLRVQYDVGRGQALVTWKSVATMPVGEAVALLQESARRGEVVQHPAFRWS